MSNDSTELTQLRQLKADAYEMTCKIVSRLALAHTLAKNTPHIQAEAASERIREALLDIGHLQAGLKDGGLRGHALSIFKTRLGVIAEGLQRPIDREEPEAALNALLDLIDEVPNE